MGGERVIAPYEVGIVVDPEFGDRLLALTPRMPVWVVDSPINSRTARCVWSDSRSSGVEAGVTIFKVSDLEDREGNIDGILDAVELHHGEYSHKPPVTICNIFGVSITPALRVAFEKLGYTLLEPTEEGFLATRPTAA